MSDFIFFHNNICCGYSLDVTHKGGSDVQQQCIFSWKNKKKKKRKKLEMCQYDTDAPAQGHPQPHAGILQKMKLKIRDKSIFF